MLSSPALTSSTSAARGATALLAECAAFPLLDAQAADLSARLEALRARFRATAAQLGLAQAYVVGRGGAPGAFAASGVAGDETLPPEGVSKGVEDLSF